MKKHKNAIVIGGILILALGSYYGFTAGGRVSLQDGLSKAYTPKAASTFEDDQKQRAEDARRGHILELEVFKQTDYWTGTLAPVKGSQRRDPLDIIAPVNAVTNNMPPHEQRKKLVIPEGTKFNIVGWNDSLYVLRLRFENGQEGLTSSSFTGSAFGKTPFNYLVVYDPAKGVDRDSQQNVYKTPLKQALTLQKDAQVAIDKEKALADSRAREAQKVAAKEALAAAREAKKRGVVIGMTKAQVIASSWGRPQNINRTISSYGTREQ